MRASTGGWLVVCGLCLGAYAGCASEGGAGEGCRGGSSPCDQGFYCQDDVCQRGDLLGDRSVLKTDNIDLLFVIDNSGSMVGEQIQLAQSFGNLTASLDDRFGVGTYNIGVITTGMESLGCPPCDMLIDQSCMNPSGENGRLQDRQGRVTNAATDPPTFSFESDPACRIVSSANQTCFFDPSGGGLYGSGTVFVGTNGCGYEKGLEPVRVALSVLTGTTNAGFLREEATLAVVVVSDEDDCGAVGDVTESVSGLGGKICYYAAKGVGPDGATEDPRAHLPYALTPVRDTYDFLMGLKGNREGMVKFVAVVGVTDPDDPSATEIEYESTAPNADILPACTTPGCAGPSCQAMPGTRYIELAELFGLGEDGLVGTICQDDFSSLMALIGESVSCPSTYALDTLVTSPDGLVVAVDGRALPRYSCAAAEALTACSGPEDTSCGAAACAETWQYLAPTGQTWAPGGYVTFASHADPCRSRPAGKFHVSVFQPAP
jgi:hypothetical protein